MFLNRRKFLHGLSLGVMAVSAGVSASPISRQTVQPRRFSDSRQGVLSGKNFDLKVSKIPINITGQARYAVGINGTSPAPTLYMTEGDTVTINVTNTLDEDTSIHWHGLLVPSAMDGVPHLSFAGIAPQKTFQYQFKIQQSGTYWYHSHSGWQEQLGMLGAIVIAPKTPDLIKADREHVLLLSDWTDQNPQTLLRLLKNQSDFDNYHQPTFVQFLADIKQGGFKSAVDMRKMWQQMRMSPTDFTDLSGVTTFCYLINGVPSADNWTGLFNRGETVRLRIINASAQTIFDFRIEGLKLTVIGSDGGLVEPVTVDEIRVGTAETYDVLIRPEADAYTIFAQDIGRSGFVAATLAVQAGLSAPVPTIDPPEWLSMTDMMGDMGSMSGMDHAMMAHHQHGMTGMRQAKTTQHAAAEYSWTNDMRVDTPRSNLDDAGVNVRQNAKKYGRKVLTYADLSSVGQALDEQIEPTRQIEMHLTGNMERYVWGFDGVSYGQSQPVKIGMGERVRISLVNDTMMTHPMHLHGMWSDLRCPNGEFLVRKHTLLVQPAQKISFDVTGEQGRWAWHCHLMYHMEAGMFREVRVGVDA